MPTIADLYAELPLPIRKPIWQIWHKVMIKYDKDVTANFMNYGYHGLNGDPKVTLNAEDENDRYCIQLYDHVVNRGDILDKDVLEVGSGRGGGASYISRYYKPRSYTGLDISSSIINFCNKYYDVPGLSFKKGIAENLPYEAKTFDAIVNVESARCYRSLDVFFNQVHRVLKDDGQFLFADMVRPRKLGELKSKLDACGFTLIHETDITANVIESLDRDTERRQKLIRNKVPGFLVTSFDSFAGAKGTERYVAFTDGTYQYWSFVLKKKQ